MLVFRLCEMQGQVEAEGVPQANEAERQKRIEAARRIVLESVESFRQLPESCRPQLGLKAVEDSVDDLPDGVTVVRSKGHLRLIGSGVAALITVSTAARDAIRASRPQIVGATTTATAAAVTVLTIAPWSAQAGAPQTFSPAPSAASWAPSPHSGRATRLRSASARSHLSGSPTDLPGRVPSAVPSDVRGSASFSPRPSRAHGRQASAGTAGHRTPREKPTAATRKLGHPTASPKQTHKRGGGAAMRGRHSRTAGGVLRKSRRSTTG